MEERLPPLNALRAFESTARHLSIKKAAEELFVTPAAVSQQIKMLENYLETQLFERKIRSISLTEDGSKLFPYAEEGFSKLEEGIRQIRRTMESNELVVSVSPTFAAKWLLPRLGIFNKAYPQYRLRIDASDNLVSFRNDGVDVALRYGQGNYPGVHCECLMEEVVVPVCSPTLADENHPLNKPDDLRHHVLLRNSWQIGQENAPCWGMWLRAAGVCNVDPDAGHNFSTEFLAVQAAIEGQGVALTAKALVDRDIRAGRLIFPFDETHAQPAKFCYFLVCPEAHLRYKKVQAFRDWIFEELKK